MSPLKSILVLTLYSLTSYGFLPDDYIRHPVQILVTSAQATQVNHGVIEAYYPDAVFYHHKLYTVNDDDTYSTKGFLVLDPKNRKETRISVSFSYLHNHKDDFQYTIDIDELAKIIPGLPERPYALQRGLEHRSNVEIATTAPTKRDSFDNHKVIPLFPLPIVEDAEKKKKTADRKEQYPTDIPPQKVFSLEMGDPKTVSESYERLLIGTDKKEKDATLIGEELYLRHFSAWPIKFDVTATDPLEPEDEAKGKALRGWYLVHSPKLKVGHLVLPRITSPGSKGGRPSLAIPTSRITAEDDDKSKLSSFRMQASDFIGLALADTIPSAADYKCMINEDNTSLTACRLEDKKQILYVYPTGKLPYRQVFLSNDMEPDLIYRVSLAEETDPSSPQGRSVAPVRFAQGLSEDSPNGNKLD